MLTVFSKKLEENKAKAMLVDLWSFKDELGP